VLGWHACKPLVGFFTAEGQNGGGRVWLVEPDVLPASCRRLRLAFGRVGEASLPFARLPGAQASTPAETTPRVILLHHLISQLRNCPARKKPLTRSTHPEGHCGQDGRAPISTQRRRALVGRVPRVRDAPQSVHPETSGGQRTARPTNPAVTARATLVRSKFCIERRAFVRAGLRARVRPAPNSGDRESRHSNRTESGAGAPRSKNFYSNPSQ